MFPILFRIGRFEVHSYGVMLAISFLIGIYWSMSRAKKRGIDPNRVMDLSLIIVFSAIVGSRLMYVVTHLDEFHGRWLDTFNPFQSSGAIGLGGLTMLGGVVFALIAVVIFCVKKKIHLLKLCDILSPSFALGIFLTRIGCFLNGCCYGKPCKLPWGVRFPLSSAAGSESLLQGMLLHPTQLYSSLYGLVILVVLLLIDRKRHFDGFLLSVFFMLYGTFRFIVDFFRFYETSVQMSFFGQGITFNQIISFLMFILGVYIYLKLRKNGSKQS